MQIRPHTLALWLTLAALVGCGSHAAEAESGAPDTGTVDESAATYTYTDLASAPVGAFVTLYGHGFGTSGRVTLGGVEQSIVQFADDRIVFKVAGQGGELMVGTRSVGTLPVHKGRVLETTPAKLRGTWASARPGDVVYMHAGRYQSISGEGDWAMDSTLETFREATRERPMALVAYPGEEAVLYQYQRGAHSPIALGDGQRRRAAWLTFANFTIVGEDLCIGGGGDTSDGSGGADETGAIGIRVVGIRCEITNAEGNTMTGLISVQGDDWQILGNTFIDPPNRKIINNNHGVYIQGGADNVEVAYNHFVHLHMGHVIQVHQDGRPKLYEHVWIHDNVLQGLHDMDMRGINVANVDDGSTVIIERNTLRTLGQEFSGIAVYHGNVKVEDNRFVRVRAPNIVVNGQGGGTRRVTAIGNRFETVGGYKAIEAENGASVDEVQRAGNRYCGLSPQERDSNPCQ